MNFQGTGEAVIVNTDKRNQSSFPILTPKPLSSGY